jgi:hypothetical protein
MPLSNDDTPITPGIDVSTSEGILIYGADSGSVARQLKTDPSGSLIVELASGSQTKPLIADPSRQYSTQYKHSRVALPFSLFDGTNKYGFDSIIYGSSSNGSGAITAVTSQSAIRLSTTATNGDRARIRSNMYYRYQTGKQQNVKISGYLSAFAANQIKRWGNFDDSNGLFFAASGSNFGVYRRTSAIGSSLVENFVSQSSFNFDKFDGTGPSGITLDVTKNNLYEIRYQWLGVGNIEVYINNSLGHVVTNIGTAKGPYMQTAVLPIAAEIENTGAASAQEFVFICASVEAEGGQEPPKYTFSAYNSTDVSVTTTERPVLAIRPGTLFRGIENRVVGLPKRLFVSTEGNRAGFKIILNPTTLTGGSWVSASSNVSAFEYNETATAFTGGEVLYRGFLPNTNDSREISLDQWFDFNTRTLLLNAFATGVETMLITGINEATGTTQMRSSIIWQEIR